MHPAIESAKHHYAKTIDGYRSIGFNDKGELGNIWRENVERFLKKLIAETDLDVPQIMLELNRRAFYDFTVKAPLLEPSLRWYRNHIERQHQLRFDELPASIQESESLPAERSTEAWGRRLSSDFLYRVSQVLYLRDLGSVEPGGSVLEIGAGYGALARTLMLMVPQRRYVILDIPETLFFAEVFLRAEFPEKRFHMVGVDSTPTEIESAEILLVPTGFRASIDSLKFDLAINTNSLGEMPLNVSTDIINWLERVSKPTYLYSLNRFLNRISKQQAHYRKEAAGCNLLWGAKWEIVDWEVNPRFEQCPYYVSTVTRNLCLVMKHNEAAGEHPRTQAIEDIAMQDWYCKPYWDNYELKSNGSKLPYMSKINPDLTPDLTLNGPLFALWDTIRLQGRSAADGKALDLFVALLCHLGGSDEPFEDILFISPNYFG